MMMTGMLHPSLRPLLRAVQEARVYDDSKAAVDLVLRRDPEEVARLAAEALRLPPLLLAPAAASAGAAAALASAACPLPPSREALAAFLAEHCDPPGSDLEPHTPEDWRPDPPRLRFLGPRPSAAAGAAAGPAGADAAAAAAAAAEAAVAAAGLPLLTDAERAAVHELARTAVHGRWKVLCRRWKGDYAGGGGGGGGGGDSGDAAAADAAARRRASLRLRSSLLPLPEPQMVPGDRFREAYYWDSYWVVRGLLASGMARTAAATVRNLVALAGETAGGHVPNGARCYYLNRSQPPLLSLMARAVAEALLRGEGREEYEQEEEEQEIEGGGEAAATAAAKEGGREAAATAAAKDLLRRALPAVERELAHWRTAPKQVRVVLGDRSDDECHALARYWARWEAPRPESQREDEATAAEAEAEAAGGGRGGGGGSGSGGAGGADVSRLRRRLLRDLASAAESGWDFSTRWMPPSAGGFKTWEQQQQQQLQQQQQQQHNSGDGTKTAAGSATAAAAAAPAPSTPTRPSLSTLRTTRVVPADLNAFLYRAERDAAWAARQLGDEAAAARLEALARSRRLAMRALLWDKRAACWRDGWLVRWRRERGGAGVGDGDGGDGGDDGGACPALDDDDDDDDEEAEAEDEGGDGAGAPARPWVLRRSQGVYASDYVPLWCGLLDDDDSDGEGQEGAPRGGGGGSSESDADRAALSLLRSGLLAPGGAAASLYPSGQQWDWPNAWPPLQHALAEACARRAARSPQARAVGLGIAAAYARAVLGGWRRRNVGGGGGGGGGGGRGGDGDENQGGGGGELHEKYDARGGGREGAGGEYAPQVGFGWTNGALLALLADGLI